MNGSVTPVSGIVLVTPPMLTKAWMAIRPMIPMPTRVPKGSVHLRAIRMPRQMK
ncbi:hypothetical protein D3C71_2204920 [compost metagenome]